MADGGYTTAGSGKSMSRALMACFVVAVTFSLVWVAVKSGEISAGWAAVAGSISVALGGIWGVGKVVKGRTSATQANIAQASVSQSGVKDEGGQG